MSENSTTTREMGSQEMAAKETDRQETSTDDGDKLGTADLLRNRKDGDQRSEVASKKEVRDEPLVPEDEAGGLRERWSSIQANFVDEPQSAVEEADKMVAEVIQSVARRFADERQKLEQQWHSGSEVSTEDLRQALQHYRSFFQRLLAA